MTLLALLYDMAFVASKPLGTVAFEEVRADGSVGAEFLVKVPEAEWAQGIHHHHHQFIECSEGNKCAQQSRFPVIE